MAKRASAGGRKDNMKSAYRWGSLSPLITRKVYQSHASTEEETVLLLHEMAFANSANH